jgi:hypothetical protein
MISLEEAIEAGLSQQAITHQVETGRIHFTASAEETTFICLNSLPE